MWNKLLFLAGVIFSVVPTVAYFFDFSVGNAILWATGLVVLWYTLETHGLRIEMVRQNEIAIQPLLIPTIELREERGIAVELRKYVVLRNIGRGPAFSVQPMAVQCRHWAGTNFVAKFAGIDCIEPGKDAVSDVTARFKDGHEVSSRDLDIVGLFNPRTATDSYEVTITYQDVGGQKRESVVQMGKGGIKLLRHGKVK